MLSSFFLVLFQPTQQSYENTAPHQGTECPNMCNANNLVGINFNSHYLEAKQSFSMVEKKTYKHALRIKVIIILVLFFFCMLFAINTSWNLNEHFRSVSSCGGKRCRSKKDQSNGREESSRRVYRCWRELITQWAASVGFEKTARASCSGWETIACLPAWVRANSKASVSCLTPSSSSVSPPPKRSLNFQFTTAHNCLQQPNFIFFSQILSHIILYIALGP